MLYTKPRNSSTTLEQHTSPGAHILTSKVRTGKRVAFNPVIQKLESTLAAGRKNEPASKSKNEATIKSKAPSIPIRKKKPMTLQTRHTWTYTQPETAVTLQELPCTGTRFDVNDISSSTQSGHHDSVFATSQRDQRKIAHLRKDLNQLLMNEDKSKQTYVRIEKIGTEKPTIEIMLRKLVEKVEQIEERQIKFEERLTELEASMKGKKKAIINLPKDIRE